MRKTPETNEEFPTLQFQRILIICSQALYRSCEILAISAMSQSLLRIGLDCPWLIRVYYSTFPISSHTSPSTCYSTSTPSSENQPVLSSSRTILRSRGSHCFSVSWAGDKGRKPNHWPKNVNHRWHEMLKQQRISDLEFLPRFMIWH